MMALTEQFDRLLRLWARRGRRQHEGHPDRYRTKPDMSGLSGTPNTPPMDPASIGWSADD
jgi:hypothetical protein